MSTVLSRYLKAPAPIRARTPPNRFGLARPPRGQRLPPRTAPASFVGAAPILRDRDHRDRVRRAVGGHPIAEKAMQRLRSVGTRLRVGRHLAGQLLSRLRSGYSNQSLLRLVHTVSVQEDLFPAKRIARIHEPCHRQVRLAKACTYEPDRDQARL